MGNRCEHPGSEGCSGLEELIAPLIKLMNPAGIALDAQEKDGKDQPAANPGQEFCVFFHLINFT